MRRIIDAVASPKLALGLLLFTGAWSAVATSVPQGSASALAVVAWKTAHPALEPFAAFIGLHAAFTAPAFLIAMGLLVLSTAACAGRRTRVAWAQGRSLAKARLTELPDLVAAADLSVPVPAGAAEGEVLAAVADVFSEYGIRVKPARGMLSAVSPRAAVWGSAVFHWALVALFATIAVGQMVRSEGVMRLAVTMAKSDEPASYQAVTSGPWHDWTSEHRIIRLDALDPDVVLGGVNRGAVPTVSLVDSSGVAVVTQRVYANNMLHDGAVAISAPGVGLAVWFQALDASGSVVATMAQPVEFSQDTSGGTQPSVALVSRDAQGVSTMQVFVSVPLDRSGGAYNESIPQQRTVRVVVRSGSGAVLDDRLLRADETMTLPGGGGFRFLGLGWSARLSVVDDPSIPFVYATMILALLGLAMSLVFQQRIVLAGVAGTGTARTLVARVRLWRNVAGGAAEMRAALEHEIGGLGRADVRGSAADDESEDA